MNQFAIAAAWALLGLAAVAKDPTKLPVIFSADFDGGSIKDWTMTDSKAWRLTTHDSGKALELFGKSNYKPKVRSPFNIALAPGLGATDFVLDVNVRSTSRDYGHRDLCLIFGYQDPSHFYYLHLGKKADAHAHSIFLVNDAPRISIAKERTDGTPWTDGWHKVRVARDAGSGLIEVFFDDLAKPIMTANDKTFTWGRIGVGSFDDTGVFDDLVIRGRRKGD